MSARQRVFASQAHPQGGCEKWSDRHVTPNHLRRRVLIVDDYAPSAEALAIALGFEGYDTHFVFGGAQALDTLKSWTPDVIVLDIDMPTPNGFETADSIRHTPKTHDMAIIAFTGQPADLVEEKGVGSGIDAYCRKGEPLSCLFSTIKNILA